IPASRHNTIATIEFRPTTREGPSAEQGEQGEGRYFINSNLFHVGEASETKAGCISNRMERKVVRITRKCLKKEL
ncbi:5372_t:CDS:1, partial [Funneliformis caledonium]